ncbi:MAG: trehalose-6-phosphate synthase [Zhengella sp.]|uniref:alpha,alpha-trehalose-phosphate synthase (UDP-forming) n=1 Tax=Zhengella sp. TaxID=2282762 RepID=UPI0035295785|nr:trehalose-6-phosphate synthase [Brucellaceae bacterium]
MNRLVIVSNRVGDIDKSTQTGGLAVAIADTLRKRGGIWFGTGEPGSTPRNAAAGGGNVRQITVPLTQDEYQAHYAGFSNSVLWPLFHYRTDLLDYHAEEHAGYLDVNRRLAEELAPLLQDDDLVWVHDYHLLPFAGFLRRTSSRRMRIGFFLHIPFPPPEVLAALPGHRALLRSLLDHDVVGFQTARDVANFFGTIEALGLGERISQSVIRSDGRSIHCGRFPIAIDSGRFHAMGRSTHEDIRIDDMRRRMLNRKQIVGVDRLDYSKGIPARFEAFEKLLETHRELEGRISLLQIAPPTREGIRAYDTIRRETEALAGAINGRFADFNWTPIKYIHRAVARDRLAAIFRGSEIGLITPLRDGMNLVAKEYVAAQDPGDPGVLVLSRFAGAAEEMEEALLVNPHDTDEMARRLHQAIAMPRAERCARHEALMARISARSVDDWAADFLAVLQKGGDASQGRHPGGGPAGEHGTGGGRGSGYRPGAGTVPPESSAACRP